MTETVSETLASMAEGLDRTVADHNRHKKAFRIAFDYLNKHWPPENSESWWVSAASDLADANFAADGDALCRELLIGIYSYLDETVKGGM